MVRSKLFLLGLVMAGLTLCLENAHAESLRVFVMGSTSTLNNNRYFTVDSDRYKSGYATGGKITLGAEYSLTRLFALEGSYAYGANNLRVTNRDTGRETGYPVRGKRLGGDLVLHSPFGLMHVYPYLLAGVEYDHFGPTSEAKALASSEGFAGRTGTLGASNKIGVNYGGGLEWKVIHMVGLRLDIRNHTTGTPTYGLPSQASGRAVFPVSGPANDFEIALGISLRTTP